MNRDEVADVAHPDGVDEQGERRGGNREEDEEEERHSCVGDEREEADEDPDDGLDAEEDEHVPAPAPEPVEHLRRAELEETADQRRQGREEADDEVARAEQECEGREETLGEPGEDAVVAAFPDGQAHALFGARLRPLLVDGGLLLLRAREPHLLVEGTHDPPLP